MHIFIGCDVKAPGNRRTRGVAGDPRRLALIRDDLSIEHGAVSTQDSWTKVPIPGMTETP